MIKQNYVYWKYETFIGNGHNVSIRSHGSVSLEVYKTCLYDFINKHKANIGQINEIIKLIDGTYCCIIYLDNKFSGNYNCN